MTLADGSRPCSGPPRSHRPAPAQQVIVDNSVSASGAKKRPGWEKVVSLITAGAVDVVVGWQADRLYRSSRDLEDILDLSIKSGVTLATVTGEMDLATADGMLVARLLGAVARQEVQIKGERRRRPMPSA